MGRFTYADDMFLESIASSLPRQSSSTDSRSTTSTSFLSFPASQLNGHAWKEEEEKKEAVAEAAVSAACLLRGEKLSLSLFSFPPKGRREGLLLLSPLPPMRPRPTSLSLFLFLGHGRGERGGGKRARAALSLQCHRSLEEEEAAFPLQC